MRRLDKVFAAFFRRVKSGETPGCPRFRGVNWFDTVEFPKDGDGCRWKPGHWPRCISRVCTRPQQDTVICPVHGPLDADVNGALNIYARAGLGSVQDAQAA